MFLKIVGANYEIIKKRPVIDVHLSKDSSQVSFAKELIITIKRFLEDKHLKMTPKNSEDGMKKEIGDPDIIFEFRIMIAKQILDLVLHHKPLLISEFELVKTDNHFEKNKKSQGSMIQEPNKSINQSKILKIKMLETLEEIESEKSIGELIYCEISKIWNGIVISTKEKENTYPYWTKLSISINTVILRLLQQNKTLNIMPDEFLYSHLDIIKKPTR